MTNYKVTAILSSPFAGDAPYLDALLECEMALRHGKAHTVQRGDPAPLVGEVHLPLLRGDFAGVRGIPRCSAPIFVADAQRHEHYTKRISVENADLLREDQRLVVATGNSWTKSYRLPNKITNCREVAWFVGGSKRRNLWSLLKRVRSIGKDRSQGYGRVSQWIIEETEHDNSWFADLPQGRLLMRVLPWSDDLMRGVIGARRWHGGFAPPYWHPDRQMEVAIPC